MEIEWQRKLNVRYLAGNTAVPEKLQVCNMTETVRHTHRNRRRWPNYKSATQRLRERKRPRPLNDECRGIGAGMQPCGVRIKERTKRRQGKGS
jgi:hypothetical protein